MEHMNVSGNQFVNNIPIKKPRHCVRKNRQANITAEAKLEDLDDICSHLISDIKTEKKNSLRPYKNPRTYK